MSVEELRRKYLGEEAFGGSASSSDNSHELGGSSGLAKNIEDQPGCSSAQGSTSVDKLSLIHI